MPYSNLSEEHQRILQLKNRQNYWNTFWKTGRGWIMEGGNGISEPHSIYMLPRAYKIVDSSAMGG